MLPFRLVTTLHRQSSTNCTDKQEKMCISTMYTLIKFVWSVGCAIVLNSGEGVYRRRHKRTHALFMMITIFSLLLHKDRGLQNDLAGSMARAFEFESVYFFLHVSCKARRDTIYDDCYDACKTRLNCRDNEKATLNK